jgi:hypothetical protein
MRAPALILVVTLACTASQARKAQRVGEGMAAGGLITMLAAITAAALIPGPNPELLDAGALMVPVVIVGAGIYVAADSALAPTEKAAPVHTHTWEAAMDLAKQAKHAARAGRCAEVQSLEPRVRDLDSDVYLRFTRDDVIRACLGPVAEP